MDRPKYGFFANRNETVAQIFLAVLIGVTLRLTIFSETLLAETRSIDSYSSATAFLVPFGLAKAFSNCLAGWAGDKYGRRPVAIVGWGVGVTLGVILILLYENWTFVIFSNVLLGLQQGAIWSMNVIMLMDIGGPANQAMASGLSNAVGYLSSGFIVFAETAIEEKWGAQDGFYGIIVGSVIALGICSYIAPETRWRVCVSEKEEASQYDSNTREEVTEEVKKESRTPFFNTIAEVSWLNKSTRAACLGGILVNFITALVWGLLMLHMDSIGSTSLEQGAVVCTFTVSKGIAMFISGHISDKTGRRFIVCSGLLVASIGIVWLIIWEWVYHPILLVLLGVVFLGMGIGAVYPVLSASISDHIKPVDRAAAVGTYRAWRDSGYAIGAVLTGFFQDALNSFTWTLLFVLGLIVGVFYLYARQYQEVRATGNTFVRLELENSRPSHT